MNSETKSVIRQDRTILRTTLLRLTATQNIVCIVGVLIVAWLWYIAASRIHAFGLSLNYDGLQAFGPQAITLLKQYSPFFWWALIIALTLIIAYFLYGLVQNTRRTGRLKLVSTQTVQTLVQHLSPQGREVLSWAWRDRREPIRIGDLQRAYSELGAGRHGKIIQAREHAALLEGSASPSVSSAPDASASTLPPQRHEPVLQSVTHQPD